jgi:hypothetical protein
MVTKSATADFDAGVSKDGHGPQRMGPSFETPAAPAPQDEVSKGSSKGLDSGFALARAPE